MSTTPEGREGAEPRADATTPIPAAHEQAAPTEPLAVPAEGTTPAAPEQAAGHAAHDETQRIAPAPTQAMPQTPAGPAYPAPYAHPAAAAPRTDPRPEPRYGQYAPQPQPGQHQPGQPQPGQHQGGQPPYGQPPYGQRPQQPQGQQPQGGPGAAGDPLAAFRHGGAQPQGPGAQPGQPGGPHRPDGGPEYPAAFGAPAGPGAPESRPRSGRERGWLPLVGIGVGVALLSSLGTAAFTGAFDGDAGSSRPADISSIGRSSTDTAPVSGSTAENPDWQAVASAVQASVVAIQVTTSQGGAEGSGVIIDDQGHIVTNNHVVSGAKDDKVQVTLTDGRIFTADVVGTDSTTDLAVVKLVDAPKDLSPAAIGDSDKVKVGDAVMAVGNPLGLANTVTTGIVSALDRPVSTTENGSNEAVVTNAIQIDAAVNPGNSGGPLFDASGRVIGITSSIATTSSQSGSIGLGFAIPVNLASMISSQLIDDGTAEHAFLGLGLADGTATADGVTRAGAEVRTVTDGSPAAKAGIKAGDVIVAIDGHAVAGAESLTGFVRAYASGADVTVTLVRDGTSQDVDVTLATREEKPTNDGGSGQGTQPGQGQGGSGGLENMTPEQLWQWFQQQQEQQQQGGQG